MEKKIVAAACALLLSACSSNKPATPTPAPVTAAGSASAAPQATPAVAKGPNAAPAISHLAISPSGAAHPGAKDTLRAEATASDPDGDGFSISWQWFKNGAPIGGAIGQILAPGPFKKGDQISVQATARDTKGLEGAPSRAETRILNSPPTVSLAPAGTNAFQVTSTDDDGDHITYSIDPPLPGLTLSADGHLTFDPVAAKGNKGKTVVVVAKDTDGAATNATFQIDSN